MVETIVQGHEVSGRAVIQNQGDCWQSPWSYGVLGPAVLQLLQTRGDPLPVFVFNSWSSLSLGKSSQKPLTLKREAEDVGCSGSGQPHLF